MKSKLISIPYTVGIIKPHIALKEDKVDEVMRVLDENNFEVFHSKKKVLTKEEILNLFYPYRNALFFQDVQEHLMTAESLVLLLINKVESIYDENKEEHVKLESPIQRWKSLIGDKDPTEAKLKDSKSLRARYGVDIIKNAFHGSDDPKLANKERDIFLFPIPERPPEFHYIKTKITLQNILKFLFPPNLEHSNTTGRLDLFALYGPVVLYHSVDCCFCKVCIKIAKGQLEETIREKIANERKRLGLTANIETTSVSLGKTSSKTVSQVKKLMPGPQRLLQEEDINSIYSSLCKKCKEHCEGFVHLTCGREGQHIMSDIEINELIAEINKNDILQLLMVEKGSTAKMMIETINLTEPSEIMYKEEHVNELLSDIETDYYERYDFDDVQKMILEDRRLRINYWVSKLIRKPIEKFKNPNLLNKNEKVNRNDIKNPYFSLQRILPISLHMEKTKVVEKDQNYDKLHFDYTAKLQQNEQDQIIQRTIMKEFHRVADIADTKSKDVAINSLLLRNYNDGRTGGWNNYCCYKGQSKGTYVNVQSPQKQDDIHIEEQKIQD